MAYLNAASVCNSNILFVEFIHDDDPEFNILPASPDQSVLISAAGTIPAYSRFSSTGLCDITLCDYRDGGGDWHDAGNFILMPNESLVVYTLNIKALKLFNTNNIDMKVYISPLDTD